MLNNIKWQTRTAWLLSLTTLSGLWLSMPGRTAAQTQARFADVDGLWANRCINSLAQRRIINGYPDGSFRPNAPVTRAEFATLLGAAFSRGGGQASRNYSDVSRSNWAYPAIQAAAQAGFLSGYPDGTFQPNQNIPRAQVLVALANGLNYRQPQSLEAVLSRNFVDAAAIPSYARGPVAAATARKIVVNYPNVQQLNPNQSATRAEVAAFLCQALEPNAQSTLISANYIAAWDSSRGDIALQRGLQIPVTYAQGDRIIVTPTETVPLTLTSTADVTDPQGQVVIPVGSEIVGQLRPAEGGSQFIAQSLLIEGQSYPLTASSDVVTRVQRAQDINLVALARNSVLGGAVAAGISGLAGNRTITAEKVLAGAATGAAVETNKNRPWTSILRDTAIGAALGAGVSGLVGDRTITPQKVISGAAAGATIGGAIDRPSVDKVVIVEPDSDLSLTLEQPFRIAQN